MAQLCDEGDDNQFSQNTWKPKKVSMIVTRGTKSSTLYMTDAKIIENVHQVESTEKIELWHKKVYHMSEKNMVEISKRDVLFGIKNLYLKKCDNCIVENKNKVSF